MRRTRLLLLGGIVLWTLFGAAIFALLVGSRGRSPLIGPLGMGWTVGLVALAFGGLWAMGRERSGTAWRSTALGQSRTGDASRRSSNATPAAHLWLGNIFGVLFVGWGLGLIGEDTLFLTVARTAPGRFVAREAWGRSSTRCVYSFAVSGTTHELRDERCSERIAVEYLPQNPEFARRAGRNSGFEIGGGLFMVAMGIGGIASDVVELRRRRTEGPFGHAARSGGSGVGRRPGG